MHKVLLGVAASIACLWSGVAQAVPNAPFFATVEMTATVTSVTGAGYLYDRNANYVRDFNPSELDRLPWNIGDRLTVRWETHSSELQECRASDRSFAFGGISYPTYGGVVGSCWAGTASAAYVDRVGGGRVDVEDGWESGIGRGPVFDMITGEVVPSFEPIDGILARDCCWYVYDLDSDTILSFDGASPEPGLYYHLSALFEGDGGAGLMHMWNFPSEVVNAGQFWDAYLSFGFDVEWRSTFERLDVPEPGALGLAGAGLLAVAGLARRRRAGASPA